MRRRRARRRSHLFLGAALVTLAVDVTVRLTFYAGNTPLVILAMFLGGLSMFEAGWVQGFDAGLRERTEETET